MVRYIVKRLLQFIPSFILITFLGFVLNDYAPVDPAERLAARSLDGGKPITGNQRDIALKQWRHKLGLDLPMFYVSVKDWYEPDTLEHVADRSEHNTLVMLNNKYKNWEDISSYYSILKIEQQKFTILETDSDSLRAIKAICIEKISKILTADNDSIIRIELHELAAIHGMPIYIHAELYAVKYPPLRAFTKIYYPVGNTSIPALFGISYPKISFHADNRYHRWLFGNGENGKGVLRGDFGLSYATGEPVGDILASRIWYTLLFSLGGIFLAYLISIPLGVYAAVKKNSWFDRTSSVVLFLLYSMPSFWLATLLLMAFANPDVLYWFEASGVKPAQGFPEGASIFEKLRIALPYLVLPMICYTYSSLAFLSRTLRVSVLEQIKQDYITTARAKGLPENKVIWRHAFRNALLPLITVLANVFPYAIGGSVILETVFTIPGLGFETFRAITSQDYPIIMAMLTLTSVLTMLGLLVQDILYALADPRISFNNTKR